jgi:DNA-binding FadR family transcriptional regulator
VAAPQFEAITRRTVAEGVREVLLESIRSGALAPGSRLPSERLLCEQFAVARTSVREAIQGLVSLGLVERRGNRLFVAEVMPGVGFEDKRKQSVTHIFEVRRLVEIPMAELAALRADPDERERIAGLARAFRADMALDDFRARDREFHESVAAACHNPALAELYAKVLEALFKSTDFESLLTASQNTRVVRRVIREATTAHRTIAAGIVSGDVTAVREAAETHLSQVEATMIVRMT